MKRPWNAVTARCGRIGDWSLLAELTATEATAIPAGRNRCPAAGAVCDSGGPCGPVALLGYRAAGGGGPQHGRSRGSSRRRSLEPRRWRAGNLPSQPFDQARYRARRDGGRRTFHRGGPARPGWLRGSRVDRCQQQSYLDGVVRRSGSAGGESVINCGARTSSAEWSKWILPLTAHRWIHCALICCSALEGLKPQPASVPIYSTVTGHGQRRAGVRGALLGEKPQSSPCSFQTRFSG